MTKNSNKFACAAEKLFWLSYMYKGTFIKIIWSTLDQYYVYAKYRIIQYDTG